MQLQICHFFFLDLDLAVENPLENLGCDYWGVSVLLSGEVGEHKVSFFLILFIIFLGCYLLW